MALVDLVQAEQGLDDAAQPQEAAAAQAGAELNARAAQGEPNAATEVHSWPALLIHPLPLQPVLLADLVCRLAYFYQCLQAEGRLWGSLNS